MSRGSIDLFHFWWPFLLQPAGLGPGCTVGESKLTQQKFGWGRLEGAHSLSSLVGGQKPKCKEGSHILSNCPGKGPALGGRGWIGGSQRYVLLPWAWEINSV